MPDHTNIDGKSILRVFQATTRPGKEHAFRKFFLDVALPMVEQQEGLLSARVGLPLGDGGREFTMITTWRDLDALKAFAGEQWDQAVIDPREAPLLEDAQVSHYDAWSP